MSLSIFDIGNFCELFLDEDGSVVNQPSFGAEVKDLSRHGGHTVNVER